MIGWIAVMLVAGAGAVVLSRRAREGVRWAGPVAALLAVAAIAVAAVVLHGQATRKPREADPKRQAPYGELVGRALGAHLAGRYEGAALVVVPPGFGRGRFMEQAMLDGLQEGFGDRIHVAAKVEPEPSEAYRKGLEARVASGELLPGEVGMLLSEPSNWFTTEGLDALVRNPTTPVDLVVVLAPPPLDFPRAARRYTGRWPPLALLYPPVNDSKGLLATGQVAAMVAMKPPREWTSAPSPATDAVAAFNGRYQLVTGDRKVVDVRPLLGPPEGMP